MSAWYELSAAEREAIRQLLEAHRAPDDRLAFRLLACDALWYAVCLAAALLSPWPVQLLAGMFAGIADAPPGSWRAGTWVRLAVSCPLGRSESLPSALGHLGYDVVVDRGHGARG